ALAIDFFFSNNKLRIISTYLTPNNPSINKQIQQKVILWTKEAVKNKIHPMILGDFNYDIIKHKTPKPNYYNYFEAINLVPLINTYYPNTPTWTRLPSQSQIDEIW
ncbi:1800_t:CDS:1, partial [Scutellospora calospora]